MSIRDKASGLLQGEVDGVLGYRRTEGSCLPHLFTGTEIGEMAADPPPGARYPLAAIAVRLLKGNRDFRLAVVVRGCDERMLLELQKQGQVDGNRLVMLGLACTAELAAACNCRDPYPSGVDQEERAVMPPGDKAFPGNDHPAGGSSAERLDFWSGQFGACLKCMGCRNICPLCYCTECALDSVELVAHGRVPPAYPVFHLIRALDMAGRCVECGLCEEACPAGIPLRMLYRAGARAVEENFNYRPGFSLDEQNPLAGLGEGHEHGTEGNLG